MSKRTRRRYTPEQKAALVRQHVVDKKPVSEICSAAQLQPSVFVGPRWTLRLASTLKSEGLEAVI